MKEVEVFTDGSCRGNPGPGGCACILCYQQHSKEVFCGFLKTTNNRMELRAIILALELLKEPCRVTIYSDSKYVVCAVNDGWLNGWKGNFWRKSDKKTVLNIDLWKHLDILIQKHECRFVWVKGHAVNENNNRCDELARSAANSKDLSEDHGFIENTELINVELF
ncbi:MAG: ribonuclease HI [Lentisphaerae bacterium]|jgi:ribonuclease HI|nr:ribonuclease HI [Lentisphaerota bacterium]